MALVLIVDDSHAIRMLLSRALSDASHTVVDAVDGTEGLMKAKQSEFDLVITDVNMPEMDGLTLLKNLRQLPYYRFKPILIHTTESSREMKMKGKQAGATGWIVKPFDPDKLNRVISQILGETDVIEEV